MKTLSDLLHHALHALRKAMRSLQWKLAVTYALMAAMLCVVIGFSIMEVLSQNLRDQDDADVTNRAVIAADLIYRSLDASHGPNLQDVLDEASRYALARVCAYTTSGAPLACSATGLAVFPDNAPAPAPDTQVASPPTAIAPVTTLGNGQPSVFGYVILSDPLTYRHSSEHSTQTAILYISLLATAIAAGVGLVLGRTLTAPLRVLTDAARQFGRGTLYVRASEEGDDEISELGVQFNRMAAQLQESFATLESERDALRTFIADMSHEIRTPITALRTFNDLLTGGAADDEEVRDEFLAESGKQIERLEWLAQNLLDLSKFDAGLADMRVESGDLRLVAARVVDETRLAGERKGVTLTYTPPETPIEGRADPRRLEQALSNVVNNGIKFTPAGGKVEVFLSYRGEMAAIHVHDTGPGIPAEELPHVFERFYRGPSTAATVSGSGLGLAIVRSIMHAHGGDIEICSEPGAGTEVILTVPR